MHFPDLQEELLEGVDGGHDVVAVAGGWFLVVWVVVGIALAIAVVGEERGIGEAV